MSNKSIESLIENMTALFISTIQNQPENKGKISVEEIIASVNSEDLQSQMKKAISDGIPKKVRSTSSKKEKKLKDENAPKRPKTSYMFFAEKKRLEIREEQPDLKMTEVSKVIGERWKEVTPESKAKYVKKADKDKERYQEELKDYVRPSDEVLLEQKGNQKKKRGKPSSADKKKRAKKPEGAPKGAKSAYMFFCAAKRDEVKESFPDYKMTEVSKELGRMWKEDFATEEEREEFVKQAAEDKERYVQEKAHWDAANPTEEHESAEEPAPKDSKAKASKEKQSKENQSKEKQSKEKQSKEKAVNAKDSKSKASKAAVESDNDDEAESPKKQEKPKPKIVLKPAAKQSAKASASSDDDSDDEPKTAKAVAKPPAKQSAKQSAKASASSDDDSDDEPKTAKAVAKPPAKQSAKPSVKAAASSDDDSDDEPKTAKQPFKAVAKQSAKPAAKNTVQIPKFIGADEETSSEDE